MSLGHEKRSGKNRMDCTRTATKKPLKYLGDVSYFKFLFLSLPVTQRFPRMFCGYQMSLMEMGTLSPRSTCAQNGSSVKRAESQDKASKYKLFLHRSMHRLHPLDNGRTEASGTGFEDLPSKHT